MSSDKSKAPAGSIREYGDSNASLSFELWNGNAVIARGNGLTTEQMREALLEEARNMGWDGVAK